MSRGNVPQRGKGTLILLLPGLLLACAKGPGQALCEAARVGNTAAVRSLLSNGVDANAKICAPEQPRPDLEPLFAPITRTIRSIENARSNKLTPLMLAARLSSPDIVELLLEAGADIDAKSSGGGTALMEAAERGNIRVLKILLAEGADIHLRDDGGETVFLKAANTVLAEERKEELLQLLMDGGAKPPTTAGSGLLHLPVLQGQVAVVQKLLEAGVEPDDEVYTPLVVAAGKGNTEMVRTLIGGGANVNIVGNMVGFGDTPLLAAAGGGHTRIVELLIQAGADVSARDAQGLTALARAAERGHTDVVEILRNAGAN